MKYKLLRGQYFIHTLRVIDYFFDRVSKKESSLACKLSKKDYVDGLGIESIGELFSYAEFNKSRHSSPFSYATIGKIMGESKTTVENYMGQYKNAMNIIRKNEIHKGLHLERGDNEEDYYDEADPSDKEKVNQAISVEEMKAAVLSRGKGKGNAVNDKLFGLIKHVVETSGFFVNRDLLYFMFYKWHEISADELRKAGDAGLSLPYQDLRRVCSYLSEIRLNVSFREVQPLLNEYFSLYAQVVQSDELSQCLPYSYKHCNKFNDEKTTRMLLLDLCRIFHATFSFEPPEGTDADLIESKFKSKLSNGADIFHYPRIEKPNSDKSRVNKPTDWAGAFQYIFRDMIERDERAEAAMKVIDKESYPDEGDFYLNVKAQLRNATPLPTNPLRYPNIAGLYNDAPNIALKGIEYEVPYVKFLDSSIERIYHLDNFKFIPSTDHTGPEPDIGVFAELETLKKLRSDAIYKAKMIGRGADEQKVYAYDSVFADNNALIEVKLGRIGYFDAVSRRDFFLRYLSPNEANLEKLLEFLLTKNRLHKFLPGNQHALLLQNEYDKIADENRSEVASLVIAKNDGAFGETLKAMDSCIQSLYESSIASNVKKQEDGGISIGDSGVTYAGCGTFVLTTEIGEDGVDRPFLLLEKRWKVSEQDGNLCYPSAGSCDMYDPHDFKRSFEKHEGAAAARYWKIEANPFVTATRELHEELLINAQPSDLELISFGLDVTRNLQQFSFLYKSDESAVDIMERTKFAIDGDEGWTFIVPFKEDVILSILNNYQIEPGAIYSLVKLMETKSDLLWQ